MIPQNYLQHTHGYFFLNKKIVNIFYSFNQLDLPEYPTKQIMIEKLCYAINEGKEGFGFV